MARGVHGALLLLCLGPWVVVALLPSSPITGSHAVGLQYLNPVRDDGGRPQHRQEDDDDVAVGLTEQDVTKDADVCSEGVFVCVRRDLALDLSAILRAGEGFNVTRYLVVERIEDGSGAQRRSPPPTLDHAGLPTLAATAIKLFQTHALVWRVWPGVVHLKVFNNPGEGMDAAVEIQPAIAARTWGAIAARRRITMALLPIMYKMGVGTTLLGVLTFIAVKTMFMVSILFVLAVSSFFKHKLTALSAHSTVAYLPQPHHKEVHLHVHTDPHRHQVPLSWNRYGDDGYRPGYGHHNHLHHEYQPLRPSHYSSAGDDAGYYDADQAVYYRRAPSVAGAYLGPHISSRWDVPVGATLGPTATGAHGESGYINYT